MNPTEQYIHDRDEQVKLNLKNRDLHVNTERYTAELVRTNYTKNFTWMGIPILQYPTDLMVMQELIWKIRPDYIIELGVAFGGMTVFYAEMMMALENNGRVFGIDIDIRQHTKDLVINHPMRKRFDFYEGSSTDPNIFKALVNRMKYFHSVKNYTTLVSLDSNHTHDHVLQELRLYSPLVSVGSYIVVFDTAIEFYHHLDKNQNRPWSKGNNPWTATQEFLKSEMGSNFVVDKEIEQRALITAATDGYLKRIK